MPKFAAKLLFVIAITVLTSINTRASYGYVNAGFGSSISVGLEFHALHPYWYSTSYTYVVTCGNEWMATVEVTIDNYGYYAWGHASVETNTDYDIDSYAFFTSDTDYGYGSFSLSGFPNNAQVDLYYQNDGTDHGDDANYFTDSTSIPYGALDVMVYFMDTSYYAM